MGGPPLGLPVGRRVWKVVWSPAGPHLSPGDNLLQEEAPIQLPLTRVYKAPHPGERLGVSPDCPPPALPKGPAGGKGCHLGPAQASVLGGMSAGNQGACEPLALSTGGGPEFARSPAPGTGVGGEDGHAVGEGSLSMSPQPRAPRLPCFEWGNQGQPGSAQPPRMELACPARPALPSPAQPCGWRAWALTAGGGADSDPRAPGRGAVHSQRGWGRRAGWSCEQGQRRTDAALEAQEVSTWEPPGSLRPQQPHKAWHWPGTGSVGGGWKLQGHQRGCSAQTMALQTARPHLGSRGTRTPRSLLLLLLSLGEYGGGCRKMLESQRAGGREARGCRASGEALSALGMFP